MSEGNKEKRTVEFAVLEPIPYEPHGVYYVRGPLTDRQREILREGLDYTECTSMRVRILLGIYFYTPHKFPSEEKRAEWLRQKEDAQMHVIDPSQIERGDEVYPPDYPVFIIEV